MENLTGQEAELLEKFIEYHIERYKRYIDQLAIDQDYNELKEEMQAHYEERLGNFIEIKAKIFEPFKTILPIKQVIPDFEAKLHFSEGKFWATLI